MKLYELQDDYAKAAAEYQATLEETEEACLAGEITAEERDLRYEAAAEIYGEYLGFAAGEFEKKAEATAKVIRNLEAEAEVQAGFAKPFETEAARYRDRERGLARQAAGLKLYLKGQMERMGIQKLEGEHLKVAVQANSAPSILSTDLDLVPGSYLIPQPPKINTELARHAWKEGREVPGLAFVRGTHLRIR